MRKLRQKTFGFFTDGPSFDGSTLEKKALGGSETALIQAARALAQRGHRVIVFNNCSSPGVYHGVGYHPRSDYVRLVQSLEFDVFIVSRFFDFFIVPIPAKLKVLWNHDTLDRPDKLRNVLNKVDLLFTLSQFHRENFLSRLPNIENKILVTRNGVDLALIDRASAGTIKDPHKVIYASRPERGLKVLLEDIWPKLIKKRRNLKLFICGYEIQPDDLAPDLLELYQYLDRLISKSKNVVSLGPLDKKQYYRHLAEASLMLYPCTFPEISCIAAIEAQACKTPIITTDGYALSETVQVPEFKISGVPGTEEYNGLFIKKTLKLLNEPDLAAACAAKARTAVEKKYTWPKIITEWERIFDLNLASRTSESHETPETLHSRLSYPRFKKENLKILFLHGKHILIRELLNGFETLGHRARLVMIQEREANSRDIIQLLDREIRIFQPDFVLTINHLGFDIEGLMTNFLTEIKMPYASWYVDSPMLILRHYENNTSDYCSIFLWDSDYIADIKALGMERVYYLPLGTDETQFKPLNGIPSHLAHLSCEVSFVGNSMTKAISKKIKQFGLKPDFLARLDLTAREFIKVSDRTPFELMKRMRLLEHEPADKFGETELVDFEALLIWRATQIYRQEIVQALEPLKPTIIGDQGWSTLLDPEHFILRDPLNYYNQLPWFYPVCKVNMNATSLQMKTGLNQRVFDLPACGAFALSDARTQMENLFEIGREAICYHEPEEALELTEFYLQNDTARKEVARQAYKRVLAEHTYRHRLSKLIDQMRRDYLS
ncbi:MAG: glycosyltransferase [Deltaproteobacteria bacterium]|nr:glycosyltransferase [Deltaproteobacteria bacterium]MBW2050803.1 glycosyltransferase [Deltaproteobacteria bacterium]MBW2140905.1 glycosyltransferase [Deltaproteobacteria bacterium]MBW2322670.1 glycosyltransferase [Deltaproteobacteria bacterium]